MENKNIYEKLLEVKKEVEFIQKKKVGDNLAYKAVSSSMILGAINKELNKLGIFLKTQMLGKDIQRLERTKSYEDKKTGKVTLTTMYDFIATIDLEYTWINTNNTNEIDKNLFSCSGLNTDPSKAFGSALTYAEKYFMMKYFNVATDEYDVDTFKQLNEDEDEKRERKEKDEAEKTEKERLALEKKEVERLTSERKKIDEAIALDEKKEQEKAKKWNDFFEKMIVDIQVKQFTSIQDYIIFIEKTYLLTSPKLRENERFKKIFEAFMPKAQVNENKAVQRQNLKCMDCKNTTEFCTCDIETPHGYAPVLAKV